MAAMIVDNNSSMFVYVPPADQTNDTSCFNGYASVLNPPGENMTLSISFSGTSVTFFGWVVQNVPAILRIDKEKESEIQFVRRGQNQEYGVIYQSQNLSDSVQEHSLDFSFSPNAPGPVFLDYAVVSVTENTVLDGELLIVDENDPSVTFEGDWVVNTSMLRNPSDGFVSRPYGDTTHQTSSLQTSASFSFNGTSVFVYGANFLTPKQTLRIVYTMDGLKPASGSTFYHAGNSTNFQWYHKDGLSPTRHTLNISVVEALSDATFIFDYVLYTPSFRSNGSNQQSSSFIRQASSSTSQPLSSSADPQSITPSPNHPGIPHDTLIGAIIGLVLFVTVVVLILLLVMYRRKLLFWSSRKRSNTVVPFPPSSEGFSQLHVFHKSSTANGQNVQIPIPEYDLPLAGLSVTSDGVAHTHRFARWWARIWRRESEANILEAFPSNWKPSSSYDQPMVLQKPPLPSTLSTETSRQSATSSTNETIVADPRVQQLEELVVSLQQEIEETRQVFGSQNGALMRELVEGHSESANQHSQQENHRVSMTMSATVV